MRLAVVLMFWLGKEDNWVSLEDINVLDYD